VLRHELRREVGHLDGEGHVVKGPNRVLGGGWAFRPAGATVLGGDELRSQAVGVLEGEDGLAEAVARLSKRTPFSTRRSVQ
jgi:hypothetical protein